MSLPRRTKCGILHLQNKAVPIYEGINLIGRNRDAVVVLRDPIASQHHAIISIINECHYISDVKSTNGTQLNNLKLAPFQMYLIEEGGKIEFTPNLIGTYKKLHTNASQLSITTQNESQMTQMEEGFFDATTQVEKTKAMFNDDLDDDLSKMVINTQFINDSITSRNMTAHVKALQAQKAPVVDIHEADTQLLVTVPSINDAATQMVTDSRPCIISAFADSQFYTGHTQHIEVSSEESQPLNGDVADVMINIDNNPPLNKSNTQSSEETSTALNTSANQGVVTSCNLAKSVDLVNPENLSEENVQPGPSSIKPTVEVKSGAREDPGSDTDVDEDFQEEIRKAATKIADLSTQTVDADSEKSKCTENSLHLQLSVTQGEDSSNDSMDMLAEVNATTLKMMQALTKETRETQAEDIKNEGDAPETNKKEQTSKTKQESADIISNSDSDEDNISPNKNKTKLRRSRFIISDSESDGEPDNDVTTKITPIKALPNDTFSDYDDSFVQRKSIGNVTTDCIPATQDGSFSRTVNESYKLGLSHIQEVTELGDISALRTDITTKTDCNDSVVNSSVVEEREGAAVDEDTQILEIPRKSFDKLSQEEEFSVKRNMAAPTEEADADSDDLMAPTQPVCRRTRSSERISIGMNSSDFIPATQDVDYEAATQKVIKDVVPHQISKQSDKVDEDIDFFAPTQQVVAFSSKAPSLDSDSEIFCVPTQAVHEFARARKESQRRSGGKSGKDTQSEDFDYDAPTQNICGVVQVQSGGGDVLDLETQKFLDDDFDAPTQPLVKEKKRVSFKVPATKQNGVRSPKQSVIERETEDVDFESPTQPIIQQIKPKPQTEVQEDDFEAATQLIIGKDTMEDETQEIGAITATIVQPVPPPTISKAQEIESQLEVMFQSQNVSLSAVDNSRPKNPLANLLDECTTQDVIGSLTGTKRLSDEFEDNNGTAKRPKTTTTPKPKPATRKSKTETPKPRVSRSSTSKAIKNEVNNNPSTSNNKSILDFLERSRTTTTEIREVKDVKLSSKLSMIKKPSEPIELLNESDNSNDVECLADTIPMKALEVLSDDVSVKDITLADKTLDTTEVRKMKRRLLDEESMNTMPTPEQIVKVRITESLDVPAFSKSNSDSNSNIDETIKSTRAKKSVKRKTEAKPSAPKRKGRPTRSTVATSAVSSDSDVEDKPEEPKTKARPASSRSSARAKKTVSYNEKSKPQLTRSKDKDKMSPDKSDSGNDERPIIITVPDKQVKLVITDKEDLRKSIAKKEVNPPVRRGRPRSKPLEEQQSPVQILTPDRNKRITKPKIIFTMLDDPKLNQIIRTLGGSIVEKLQACTVLVTSKVQRTLKLLAAIGSSIPICSPEWLLECKKANAFLDPWDHLIKDEEAEEKWNFKIGQALEKSKQGKLFVGYQFLLIVTLSADVVKGAIEANGGKVVSRKPSSGNFVVVAAASQKNKYATYLKSNVPVVSSEAILVGILRQEVVFDEYALS